MDGSKYIKLQQQFLCCYPVNKMAWSTLNVPLDLDAQRDLIAATCAHPLNKQYPVRRSYQEAFIKRVMLVLKDHDELHDDIYKSLCDLLDNTEEDMGSAKYAYKHYMLNPDKYITLRESNYFVTDCTTGLCTWEAALVLADYLWEHPSVMQGKNILELGAGAGFLGILLKQKSLKFPVGNVVMTDGNEACVKLMRENVALNFEWNDTGKPQCAQLCWSRMFDFQWITYGTHTLVLAADVVYDVKQFPDLLSAMDFIFEVFGKKCEMLLASTVRNVETLHTFMEQLEKQHYLITPCANVTASASHFCRDPTAAVQIVSIKR